MRSVPEVAAPDRAAGERTLQLDAEHVFHSWSAQAHRSPLAIAGGSGSYVWDFDGTRYLDFSSQLVYTNIGHQHPAVVSAIQEQAARLCTVAPQHANDMRGEAARLVLPPALSSAAVVQPVGGEPTYPDHR